MDNQQKNKKNSGLEQAHPGEEIQQQNGPNSPLDQFPLDEEQQPEISENTAGSDTVKERDQGSEQWPAVSWP